MFETEIKALLLPLVKGEISLEIPPDATLGDFAFPCFSLAKEFKKSPNSVAQDIAKKIAPEKFLSKIEAKGAYVNFFVNKTLLAKKVLEEIYAAREAYGMSDEGKGRVIVQDFSHPNIAKPFHIGHLRSTIIGNALYKMFTCFGYRVIRINYLGDWGTQFGKLIVAYLKWKDDAYFKKDPIKYLLEIYVKFHAEAKTHRELEDEARKWFKRLEDGDVVALKLWAKFRQVSIHEFQRIYDTLKVEFDSWDGESFFNDKIDAAVNEVEKKSLAILDDGALVVKLDAWGMPAFMLRKSDEASTYHSRDLAAVLYRLKTYRPEKLLYVVGSPQKLHFQQLFKVLELMGIDKNKFVHIEFGHYRLPEGKISTRSGKVIFMEDVLAEAIERAKKTIEEKNPNLKNKKDVSAMVGIGAVIFSDVVNDRVRDIVFDWDKILDFEGDTAPYLQYTYARAQSVIRKACKKKLAPEILIEYEHMHADVERRLVVLLSQYMQKIRESLQVYKPHILAQYLISVGRTFNEFYHACPVIQAEKKEVQQARLLLVSCSAHVIKNGLALLGIECPEEM